MIVGLVGFAGDLTSHRPDSFSRNALVYSLDRASLWDRVSPVSDAKPHGVAPANQRRKHRNRANSVSWLLVVTDVIYLYIYIYGQLSLSC